MTGMQSFAIANFIEVWMRQFAKFCLKGDTISQDGSMGRLNVYLHLPQKSTIDLGKYTVHTTVHGSYGYTCFSRWLKGTFVSF